MPGSVMPMKEEMKADIATDLFSCFFALTQTPRQVPTMARVPMVLTGRM